LERHWQQLVDVHRQRARAGRAPRGRRANSYRGLYGEVGSTLRTRRSRRSGTWSTSLPRLYPYEGMTLASGWAPDISARGRARRRAAGAAGTVLRS
jgi:hypothetical protein